MDSNLKDSDKTKVGIYLLRNKDTNEVYIGSGKLNDRLKSHRRELENNNHGNYKLQRSFNKHPDIEFIDKLNGNKLLLNIAMSVDKPTLGTKLTEEHKEKIGKKSREMWEHLPEDKVKQHSEKISKAQKKHWSSLTKEEKYSRTEVIRNASIGKELSEEHKKKVGDFFRGRSLSEDHKDKISNALKDKHKDPKAILNAVNARMEKGSYKANESQKLACSHPVIIDGKKFPSIKAAAKAIGVSDTTVNNRIKDENFTGWVKVSDQSNQI